uniref:Uncharacterized protein n=1 Tax=Arundo donax TaxID=35708 RepID=A0A0A8ZG74_ARUDO
MTFLVWSEADLVYCNKIMSHLTNCLNIIVIVTEEEGANKNTEYLPMMVYESK